MRRPGLWRRFCDEERGITLVLALMILAGLSIATMAAIGYSASNGRWASYSYQRSRSKALAEAGINNAVALLANPTNNALDRYVFCTKTAGQPAPPLPCWQTATYEGGTVSWTGELVSTIDGSYWKITSVSTERNTAGGTRAVKSTLSARVPIYPTVAQPLNNPAWNYIFATQPASPLPTCDMTLLQSVQIASPLYVFGNLCLENSSSIVKGPLVVRGRLTLRQQATRVGSSASRISEAHLGNGCEWIWGKRVDVPCAGDVDNVYVTPGKLDTIATNIAPPVPDWRTWYLNASPGPYYPCLSPSGSVPMYDTQVAPMSATDDERFSYMNNSAPTVNLTPSTSYTCKSGGGELSWNATTRVLTVKGTIFIDGSAYIQNGSVNEYNGQATLYLSGTFLMKNSKLCGGVNAGKTDCDYSAWNPNTELLCVVTNSSGGQANTGDGIYLVSSTFEGAMQATANIETDTTSKVDGPLVANSVILGQSVNTSFPTITIVPVGMPSNPAIYAQPGPPQLYSG